MPPCDSSAYNQQESDLLAVLDLYGPLSVCVDAEGVDVETLNHYTSGIYSEWEVRHAACVKVVCGLLI